MTSAEFCKAHPLLYHMATADSLDQIMRHGLLSTCAILDLVDADTETRAKLASARRAELTHLEHATHGKFTLRDQKPMTDAGLDKCLKGMTKKEWYETLNSRVFLWASIDRVEGLLAARAYRSKDQLVLTIDSASLVAKHVDSITVATLNTGSTLYVPVKRGKDTFLKIADHPTTRETKKIVEVTVTRSIPDIRDHIVSSEVRKPKGRSIER